ncbi:MAG: DEAD/DEAH box helicase family protein [Chloroflexi bacterium]|nr:DEAD/DEAH box helicase family protein [Chloroflexota bacterium]
MKLLFDSSQEYQLNAVRAVVDVFEGQPLAKGEFEISFAMEGSSLAFTEKGIGNRLVLSQAQLLENIRAAQTRNGIALSSALERCEYIRDAETGATDFIPLNFTVEMETGTGKTYVYLRTVYELNKVYGFKKFVIVVPSVAIREGAVKNLEITHDHFQDLYGNPPINFLMYDSRNLTALRNFATSNAIQILVINIDSFTKDTNVINTVRETGVKPIEYLQATCPIVIVDEPQNMETEVRRAALHNLNPLCTLRYSATHRNLYNLVYTLNPVQAYDLGLVKQIEVDGITADGNYNAAYIQLKKIERGKKQLKAKVTIYANESGGVKPKDVTLGLGDDLYEKSGERDIYRNGFILNHINAEQGTIEFSGGAVIAEGATQGGLTDDVLKYQIEETVKHHFEKVARLQPRGIKVLSLFFIDRVANYREYDADGNPVKGKFAVWFETAFARYARQHGGLIPFSVDQVHNGYFSSDKRGTGKEKQQVWVDSREKNTKADEDTYSLIMKEKERLLSLDEPLQFIFSHSALREGWDNPNVFQICTLNETKSDLKKRQEIGRGLRLPVNSAGLRVQDKHTNVLTVVANETYEDFSDALQREIQEETSVEFKGRIKNARDKAKVRLTKELTIENFPLLFDIWERIKHHTRYRVEYDTVELIRRTVAELSDLTQVPLTKPPMLEAHTARLNFTEEGVTSTLRDAGVRYASETRYVLPDVYGYIQNRLDVSRNTIYEILKQSGRYAELEINPQLFLDNVVGAIRRNLSSLMVEGVKYEQINGAFYEMALFKFEEIETYLANLFAVSKPDKTPFNYVPIDSEIESNFARDCEADEHIKFFFKLPRGFRVHTPIGDYIPDWAVVMEHDSRVYFVAETKGTLDWQLLRGIEQMKIECGAKHFALLKPLGVEYKRAVTTRDLY